MKQNKDKYFLDIFTELMTTNHSDCIVEEDPKDGEMNIFRLDSKSMVIQVYRTSFYFQLNSLILKKVKGFSVPLLKFGISLSATTGKGYSYFSLGKRFGVDEDDILMNATYVFTCVNYTLKLFESKIEVYNSQKIKNRLKA
jgi:hypothetical protein